MAIDCDHPRPALDLPGYIPHRMAWQVPTFIPGLPPDAARSLREALQGVYNELARQGQHRNVIPLVEDLYVRPGSVVVGVANGQTVTLLPPGASGYLDPVTLLLTDVATPVTIVFPDGTSATLGTAGAYEYFPASPTEYETSPGASVLAGGVPTDRLLGRDSAGTGAVEFIALTAPLEFTGAGAIRIANLGITTALLADANVTLAKLANLAAGTVIGRDVNGVTGVPQALTGTQVGELLRLPSGSTGFLAGGTYDNFAITEGVKVLDVGSTGGDITFTGFAYGASNTSAFFFLTKFGSGYNITIPHLDGGSLAANQVSCPGGVDYVMTTPGHGVLVAWDNSRLQIIDTAIGLSTFPGAPIYDVMAAPFFAAGDGTTDDTAAINAAIAAANAVPGMIYLGHHHRITAALTPITGNNIVIQGRGRFDGGSVISIDAAAADDFIVFEGQYSGIQDVWIRGVGALYATGAAVLFFGTFQGFARRLNITSLAIGIEVDTCTLTKIEECSIGDLYGETGVWVHGTGAAYCHATWISNSVLATTYPVTKVGRTTTWQASTAYIAGNAVVANGYIYQATVGGTSAGAGTGPSGAPGATVATAHTATITDGTVTWIMSMPHTTWILHDSSAHTVRVIDCACLQGGYGVRMTHSVGGASDYPQFLRCVNLEIDNCTTAAVTLDGGGQAEFEQLFVTAMNNGPCIDITSGFLGNWRFNGGVLFASVRELVTIAAGDGRMANMIIGAGGLLAANTYDAVTVAAGVQRWSIEDCSIGRMLGSASPQTRYGINIGASCDNYSVQGNIFIGHQTGAILNTPGTGSTRIVRNNIPDSVLTEIEETGAGPFNDYNPAGARHIMASNAAGVFTGVLSTGLVGDEIVFSHQGTGYTEFQHNTGSTAGNAFFTGRLGKSLRIYDNEIAVFRLLDRTSGGTTQTSWELMTPSFPFAHASDSATGDVIAYTGGNYVPVAGGNNANVVLRGDATFGTVSNAALATIASPRLKGRTTAATGVVEDLTLTTTATVTPNTSVGGAIGWDVTSMPAITEVEETGAGPFNDYDSLGARHIMGSNAAGVFTGVLSTGFVVGAEVIFSHQGTGYTECQHNTGSAAGNAFFTGRQGRALRIFDNEIAIFRLVDTVSGGTTTRRWELQSPLFPWAQSSADAAGDITMHNGTNYIAVQPTSTSIVRNGTTWERAALTSDVTAPQNSNVTTIAAGVVTLAKQANLAQSRIIGRSAGAGTGVPEALTPTQVIAIVAGESPTWTGSHTHTGAAHTVTATADVRVETTAGGVAIGAGHAITNPANTDILLNATGGVVITAHSTTPTTGATAGQVALSAEDTVRVLTAGVERLEIEDDGAWQLSGDSGTTGDALLSRGAGAPPVWGEALPGREAMVALTTRTNSTTALAAFANYDVAAGTWGAGTTYVANGTLVIERGATLTAVDVTIEAGSFGAYTDSHDIEVPTSASSTVLVNVEATMTCLSTGGSGTWQVSLRVWHATVDLSEEGACLMGGTTNVSPHTLDTTVVNALTLRATFSAAVSGCSMTWNSGYLRHVF